VIPAQTSPDSTVSCQLCVVIEDGRRPNIGENWSNSRNWASGDDWPNSDSCPNRSVGVLGGTPSLDMSEGPRNADIVLLHYHAVLS
jgi:hypothetical protein